MLLLIFILILLVCLWPALLSLVVPIIAAVRHALSTPMSRSATGAGEHRTQVAPNLPSGASTGGAVSFSRKFVHTSKKSTDVVHEQAYNDEQMQILNEIYAKTLTAKALLEYAGDNVPLLEALERFVLTNYNSLGEFYVAAGDTVEIFRKDLQAGGLEEHFDHCLEIISAKHEIDSEYLVATISGTDEFEDVSLWNVTIVDGVNMAPLARISYGEFAVDVPQYRVAMMRRYANDMDIILAAMRYYCLLSQQRLMLPLSVYKEYTQLGATIEGFVSPFNTQIMRLENIFGTYRFCSIFDEDVVFNSLGNYFTTVLAGKFVIMSPPKVESILSSAAKKCIAERRADAKTRFVFYGPDWPTSEYYVLLMGFVNEGLARVERLEPGAFKYEDPTGAPVEAAHPLMVFKCL